ncbi:PAAR domain-containing protein [Providencia stuartii]|uniref:PAAR domain-containing protein n=1 Tax=Providencia stuartii TaxID=588 RepID=UPI003332D6BE
MTKNIILLSDKTSHGGSVITATSDIIIDGKRAAKICDLVSYPKKGHGTNAIIEGATELTCKGIPVVVDRSKTECGCYLIASITDFNLG